MEPDRQRVAALVELVNEVERAAAVDHHRRTEIMDELQDAVGLNGKMVTDRDILKRAERVMGAGT